MPLKYELDIVGFMAARPGTWIAPREITAFLRGRDGETNFPASGGNTTNIYYALKRLVETGEVEVRTVPRTWQGSPREYRLVVRNGTESED